MLLLPKFEIIHSTCKLSATINDHIFVTNSSLQPITNCWNTLHYNFGRTYFITAIKLSLYYNAYVVSISIISTQIHNWSEIRQYCANSNIARMYKTLGDYGLKIISRFYSIVVFEEKQSEWRLIDPTKNNKRIILFSLADAAYRICRCLFHQEFNLIFTPSLSLLSLSLARNPAKFCGPSGAWSKLKKVDGWVEPCSILNTRHVHLIVIQERKQTNRQGHDFLWSGTRECESPTANPTDPQQGKVDSKILMPIPPTRDMIKNLATHPTSVHPYTYICMGIYRCTLEYLASDQ